MLGVRAPCAGGLSNPLADVPQASGAARGSACPRYFFATGFTDSTSLRKSFSAPFTVFSGPVSL